MKIGNISVKISAVAMVVFIIFTAILIFSFIYSGDRNVLLWGVPTLVLLLVIPTGLNYLSQNQYQSLIPEYEKQAKTVRIKGINLNMLGQPVRFQGVVERVYFRYLNRPQYLIADKTGEISVKMFTSPQEDVHKNDIVEVLGLVIKRYILTGDAVVNCVSIRKVGKEKDKEKKT